MSIDGPKKTGLEPQQRLEIRAGMTVDDVKKYGSDGQKLAASLFDSDLQKGSDGKWYKDGVFNEKEAAIFNRFNFTLDKGAFRMYDQKTGHVTEFKFTNIEDLKNAFGKIYSQAGSTMHVFFEKDGKVDVSYGHVNAEGGKTTIDLNKKSVEINGVEASTVGGIADKMSVINSDVENISSGAKELKVKGTKDKGLIWDSSTNVYVNKDTRLNISSDSDVKIERDK